MSEQALQRRVVCAAIKNCKGEIICSARHFDPLMHEQIRVSKHRKYWKPVWKIFGIVVCRYPRVEQGFIDQWCQWMTREEALDVAKNTGQILRHCGMDRKELFSENLY